MKYLVFSAPLSHRGARDQGAYIPLAGDAEGYGGQELDPHRMFDFRLHQQKLDNSCLFVKSEILSVLSGLLLRRSPFRPMVEGGQWNVLSVCSSSPSPGHSWREGLREWQTGRIHLSMKRERSSLKAPNWDLKARSKDSCHVV